MLVLVQAWVTSLGGERGGGAVWPALLLAKKRAGASQAAGCLPAGGGPSLLLEPRLQPDTTSHIGSPVHCGSLGHPGGQHF